MLELHLQYEMWWPAYSMAGRGSAVTASYPGNSCHSLRVIGVTAGDTARQAFFFWSRVQLQAMNPPDDLVSMVSFSGTWQQTNPGNLALFCPGSIDLELSSD